ncbi:hypothetical protein [Neobacillus endophyticus]|uniref:hypothetical protein n=1 Tax=Neobacillus endophyticus TaxID=2738405 RepID=UPI001C278494|nr:hypothetical protein [Neobacillus endophyticus]
MKMWKNNKGAILKYKLYVWNKPKSLIERIEIVLEVSHTNEQEVNLSDDKKRQKMADTLPE